MRSLGTSVTRSLTPTTVKAGFVSAILSAGYHVELAGGGGRYVDGEHVIGASSEKEAQGNVGKQLAPSAPRSHYPLIVTRRISYHGTGGTIPHR